MNQEAELGPLIVQWLYERHVLPSNISFIYSTEDDWEPRRKLVVIEERAPKGRVMRASQSELIDVTEAPLVMVLRGGYGTINASEPNFFETLERELTETFVLYGISSAP